MKRCAVLVLAFNLIYLACEKDEPREDPLVTRGRQLFNDTRLSRDNDQSCATCHPNGHMDHRRWHFSAIHGTTDGVPDSFRTLTLWGISETGPPYLWDVSRRDLHAVTRLYVDTIMGGTANEDDIEALVAYQNSLKFPVNPWRNADGSLTPAQQRGKIVYETNGFCSPCHPAPTGTTTKPKDIGTGLLVKTPGLRSLFSSGPYFHDGRFKTLREVIDFYIADPGGILHSSGFVINLTEQEKNDLIEYLRTF
ncbi:c-type cytochrome [bacterium]|nr:c-type cytochrome [bacterium]